MSTVNMVVGATTPDGATFVAKVDGGGPVRVAVADNADMLTPVFTALQAVDAQGVAKVSISGLDSDTRYWWQVEDNAVIDDEITGQFLTHPPLDLPASFTIGAASCAGGDALEPGVGDVLQPDHVSNHDVFGIIGERAVNENWLMFAHLGDLHYYNLGEVGGDPGDLTNYRRSYDDVLLQPNQHSLYRSVPWTYVWDDHDYGPNNSDGTLPTKANAQQVFRERVPHYPLPDPDAIYQPFQIGRVLFVMSDTRSERSPNSDPDGPAKTMLGAAQKTWLTDLLTNTAAEALVWLMPTQWLPVSGTDTWANFGTERDEIVTILDQTNWLDRMVMVYGDRHALGLQSGATNAWGGFPVLMAASLDSNFGTPNNVAFDVLPDTPGRNQYGTITINDTGLTIGITLTAWNGTTSLGSYTTSIEFPIPPVPLPNVTALLSGSHDIRYDVLVLETFQTGDDPSGTEVELVDGEVTIDGTRDVRGKGRVRLSGTFGQDGRSTFPRARSRLFAPYGNEIFIRYVIDLGGGGEIGVPLGYYRISTTAQSDAPVNPIRLSLDDRMATIVDSELIDPRSYAPPMTVGDVFDDLILDVYPLAVIQFDDATVDIPLGREVIAEKNRFKPLQELAESFGKIVYWNNEGILRIETPPEKVISWEVRSGREGVLVNANRQITRDGIFNAVVVEGEGGDAENPVRAIAIDADPTSPTRFGGPLGRIPHFLSTPLVTTQPQAEFAAAQLLRRAIGAPYNIDFNAIMNPSLRPYDTVRITYNNGDRDVHIIDSVKIPLDEDSAMSAQTREEALIVIGEV